MAGPDREPLIWLWASSGRTRLRVPPGGTAGLPTGMRFLETAAPGYQTAACIVETWPNRCRHCDLVETASLSRLCSRRDGARRSTTDAAQYWLKEMTPAMALANSPHLHVGNISTPMLVIHGDKDYRVPIGEGLRLWYELLSKSKLPADQNGESDHRFLYFPDENHWVLQPQHAKVWYGVVEHFLARNLLDKDLPVPAELGL